MGCGCSAENHAASTSGRATHHGTSWPLDGHRRSRRRSTVTRREDSETTNTAVAHPLSLTSLHEASAAAQVAPEAPQPRIPTRPQQHQRHPQPLSSSRRRAAGIGGGVGSFTWRRWERSTAADAAPPPLRPRRSSGAVHAIPAGQTSAGPGARLPATPLSAALHTSQMEATMIDLAASDAPSTMPSAHRTPSTPSSAWLDNTAGGTSHNPRLVLLPPSAVMTVTASSRRGHIGGIPLVDSVDDFSDDG